MEGRKEAQAGEDRKSGRLTTVCGGWGGWGEGAACDHGRGRERGLKRLHLPCPFLWPVFSICLPFPRRSALLCSALLSGPASRLHLGQQKVLCFSVPLTNWASGHPRPQALAVALMGLQALARRCWTRAGGRRTPAQATLSTSPTQSSLLEGERVQPP